MSVGEFRASTPEDAAAISELCRRVLHIGAASPMFEPALLHWKYWQAWPRLGPSSPAARSYVIARDGELLAHIAAIPVTYRSGGAAFTLLHPLDWAARPDVIGVGATLLSKLAKVADGVLVVGGSTMTQRMLGPLGYRRLADVCRYAAPPSAGASALLEVRFAVDGDQPELGAIFEPQRVAARSPALLDVWRACPAIVIHACDVLEHGQLRGGFVLSQTPGQVRLVDTWCSSSRPSDWARVFQAARSQAARLPGAAEVVTLANTPLERQALVEAGFRDCGRLPLFVRSELPLPEGAGLRFQMIDGDAALLHHGNEESWLGRAP